MQKAFDEASEELFDMIKNEEEGDSHMPEILIVDDEMINIDVVSLLLFSRKISFVYALSG